MKSRLDDDLDSDRPLVVFLGDDVDEQDHDVLFPLLRARGTAVVRVHPHDLVTRLDEAGPTFTVDGRPLRPDLVVGWVLDELLLPGMAQLDMLARAGIPVVNDALTLFRAQHKFLDSSQLSAAGVLRYPVITGRDRAALLDWMAASDRPAVFKPLSGFGGRGLQKLADVPAAHALLDSLDGEPYYVVPYIDNPGRDIRVYTVNHHPVFAIYRYAADGAWVTNILAGGSMAVCPLSDEIVDLAARASRASGTLIGGIDIGENTTTGELVVYEVNSCPTCEPPVLEAIADFLAAAVTDREAGAAWRPQRDYTLVEPTFHPGKPVRPA